MKLLCVVGKKRSGKDTVSDIILNATNSTKYALADPIKSVLNDAYNTLNLGLQSYVDLSLPHFYGKTPYNEEYDRETCINISNKQAVELFENCIKNLQAWHGLKQKNATTDAAILQDSWKTDVINSTEHWSVRRFMQVLGTDIIVNCYDKNFWNRMMLSHIVDNMDKDYFIISDIRQTHEIELMRTLGAIIIFVERPCINNNTNRITDTHITESGLDKIDSDLTIVNDSTIEDLTKKLNQLHIIDLAIDNLTKQLEVI